MRYWKKRNPSVRTLDEAVESLSGLTIGDLMDPPDHPFILGLEEAVSLYKKMAGGPVTVVGDYDVDGVMSSAIMKIGLTAYSGKEPAVVIPRRKTQGYGAIPVSDIDGGLLITIDNGISAADPIREMKGKGVGTIVIDHHMRGAALPEPDVLVDPEAIPGSAFVHYCGAGLAYRFVELLLPDEPELLAKLLSLAAVATVADIVPLVGDNRNIVRKGLRNIAEGRTTDGMLALLAAADITDVDAEKVGYYIGPMLNAPGRLYDDGAAKSLSLVSMDGLLIGDRGAERLAREIKDDNGIRREMVAASVGRAMEALADAKPPIVWYDPECDEGVAGIVAGQLAEAFRGPAIVLADSLRPGIIKGSGRCVPEVDLIRDVLDPASGHLLGYGGHSQAAGLSMELKDLEAFKADVAAALPDFEPKPAEDLYDVEIRADEVPQAAKRLSELAPFGEGVPEPVFKVTGFTVRRAAVIGKEKNHVSLKGSGSDAVGFGMAGKYSELGNPAVVDGIGHIGVNRFRGMETVQLRLEDFWAREKKTGHKVSLDEFLSFF